MALLKKIGKVREISSLFFLIFLFGLVGLVNSDFLIPTGLFNCLNDGVVFIALAVGVIFVILTGEVDVSTGVTLGLSVATASTILRDGGSGIFAVLAAVLVGCLVGLSSGSGVAKLGIPPLIFTLDTNGLVHGLVYVHVGGTWVENLPVGFVKMANIRLIGELTTFYAMILVLVIAAHLILIKTWRGKYSIAVGDNPAGAVVAGIPIIQTKIMAYVLCGLLTSVAGVLYSSRIGFITSAVGSGYEMKVIAIYMLGGISLSGGPDSLIGASVGVAIVSSISRILVFLGFFSDYDNTITGILLTVIVVVDAVTQNRATVKTRHARLVSRSGPLEEEPGDRRAAS